MTEGSDVVLVADVLTAMGDELAALAKSTEDIEHAVGPLLETPQDMSSGTMQQIQGLDRIRQGLEDLAVLTTGLADSRMDAQLLETQRQNIMASLKLDRSKSLVQQVKHPPVIEGDQSELHLF